MYLSWSLLCLCFAFQVVFPDEGSSPCTAAADCWLVLSTTLLRSSPHLLCLGGVFLPELIQALLSVP